MKFILDCPTINEVADSHFIYLVDGFDFSSKVNNALPTIEKTKLIDKVVKKISKEKLIFIGLKNNVTEEENLAEAIELNKASQNVSIVLHPVASSLGLCNALISNGISTSLSPCLSVSQAIIFAKTGVNFIFLPLGKFEDSSINGIELVAEIRAVFDNYPDFTTQIVTRSIRSLIHITESAKVRSDAISLSNDIFNKMTHSPLV